MKTRHTFKVLSKKEVERNRSSKYRYIKLESVPKYIQTNKTNNGL